MPFEHARHDARRWGLVRVLFLVPAAAAVLAGCASNPVTGSPDLVFQSEAGEIKKSKEVHPMLLQQFGGVYDDQQVQQYVNEVGQRAAKVSQRPELQYTFTVLDSEEINAFTTGGGYVYITRGIMNYLNNEAELEAVLGHEIGHVCARHPVRQQSKSTLAGIGAAAVGIFTGSADLAGLANYAGAALVQRLRPRPGAGGGPSRCRIPGEDRPLAGSHGRRRAPAEEPGAGRDPACPRGEASAARLSRRLRLAPRQRSAPA